MAQKVIVAEQHLRRLTVAAERGIHAVAAAEVHNAALRRQPGAAKKRDALRAAEHVAKLYEFCIQTDHSLLVL